MHDLIVIGDDLSAHVAAATAAGYGLDTVLIAEYGAGGVFLLDNSVFNIDPTPLTGFGANQTFLSLFAEIDIPLVERECRILDPAYQIILPEHRIDFFHDKDALIKEMAREFPGQADEIKAFYETAIKECEIFGNWLHDHPFLQPQNIYDWYKFIQLAPHLFMHVVKKTKFKSLLAANDDLRKVFEAQEVMFGCIDTGKNSFPSNFLYCAPLRGVYHFPQGKQILFNSLIRQLELKNGLYLSNCDVVRINKGKTVEVEIAGKTGSVSAITAKKLIITTKWEKMHLLLQEKKTFNFTDWLSPVKVSHLPYTLHLTCSKRCLPERMARHLAVVSDVGKDIYDDNLIVIEADIDKNESITAPGNIPLTATVFLPNDPAKWSRENLIEQSSVIMERLEFFLPFLKENIKFFDPEKSIEISKMSHSVFNPKYRVRKSFFTGFTARTNKTRFKNIYLTGASLLTDAGFEGEVISGINAASRVIAGKD